MQTAVLPFGSRYSLYLMTFFVGLQQTSRDSFEIPGSHILFHGSDTFLKPAKTATLKVQNVHCVF